MEMEKDLDRADMAARSDLEGGQRAHGFGDDAFRVEYAHTRAPSRHLPYKRVLDMIVAALVMVLGAPLFALVYLAVVITSRGPAIYACNRVGRDGLMFRCYKFRTMVVGADQALRVVLLASPDLAAEFEREFKLRRDPRVTRLGRFLRRTSLDELPQFWNVMKGDMSVIGWRPLVPDEIPRYGEAFPVVAALRPGITGLWQVSGRNDVSYPERVELDVRYAHEAGLLLDVSILGRTVAQMARWSGNGAY
jgi:lipopolysaccharide/colanic/teichoic acid biosynthesis glycosyltransferase